MAMQALKRIGQRDDVASGHRILASDEARSITGDVSRLAPECEWPIFQRNDRSCLKADFANEPFRAPFETRFPFQLANHLLDDPATKPLACRCLHGRTSCLGPAKG